MIRSPRSRSKRWTRPGASRRARAGRVSSGRSGATRATIVASPTASSTNVSEPIGSSSPTVASNAARRVRRLAVQVDRDVLRADAERDARPVAVAQAERGRAARARSGGPAPTNVDAVRSVLERAVDEAHPRLADERRDVQVVAACRRSRDCVPNWTILPSRMTAIRSDSVIASSWSWVTNTLVVPERAGGGA